MKPILPGSDHLLKMLQDLSTLELYVFNNQDLHFNDTGIWEKKRKDVEELWQRFQSFSDQANQRTQKRLVFRDPQMEESSSDSEDNESKPRTNEFEHRIIVPLSPSPSTCTDIDPTFFKRLKNVEGTILFLLNDRKEKHKYHEAGRVLFDEQWDPEFIYYINIHYGIVIEISEMERMLFCNEFNKLGTIDLFYTLYKIDGLLALRNEGGDYFQYLTEQLEEVKDKISKEFSTRDSSYFKIEDIEQKINSVGAETKDIYWQTDTNQALGHVRVRIQELLFTLFGCRELLKGDSIDYSKSKGLNEKIYKIENQLSNIYKYLIPFLIKRSAQLKLNYVRGLSNADALEEIKGLEQVAKQYNCKTLGELSYTLAREMSVTNSEKKSLEFTPRKMIGLPQAQGAQLEETDARILQLLPKTEEEQTWEEIADPRVIKIYRKFRRQEASRQMLSFEKIENYQKKIWGLGDRICMSAGTRKIIGLLSFKLNKLYLERLQKKASISQLQVDPTILNAERNKVFLFAQELVVVHYLENLIGLQRLITSSNEGIGPPYFPPSPNNRQRPCFPRSRTLDLIYPPLGDGTASIRVEPTSDMMNYVHNQAIRATDGTYEESEVDSEFQNPITLSKLKNPDEKHTLQLLSNQISFSCNVNKSFKLPDENFVTNYLDSIRKEQAKNNLGDIGFYIEVRSSSNDAEIYHIAACLYAAPIDSPLAEITLLNQYGEKPYEIAFGSTKQLNDYIPTLLLELSQAIHSDQNQGSINFEVSFLPFCDKDRAKKIDLSFRNKDIFHPLDQFKFLCESTNRFRPASETLIGEYLNDIRKTQAKGDLGDIEFHIEVRSPSENAEIYDITMQLQATPISGLRTEIKLQNPYGQIPREILFSSTDQLNDYMPILLGDLSKISNNNQNYAAFNVSFFPYCNKDKYQKSLAEGSIPLAPSKVASNFKEGLTEVVSFPCSSFPTSSKIAVRGDIPGLLNWNQNIPLLVQNGRYIFEVPQEMTKGMYKFVMLTENGKEIWEVLPKNGNRNLSVPNATGPIFNF